MRLLLAEDERELSNALSVILRHSHYSVDVVDNGADALDYALGGDYDGLILDILMPGLDGIQVLKKLRERGITTPALFLTAKAEVDDRIKGLDTGADDYITKPFDMGELLARVRAMTRRGDAYTPQVLRVGNLTLDRGTYEMAVDRQRIRLGNKEFQMLEMLMTTPRRLISTDQFLERIWGWDAEAENTVVWVYISGLRKKLASLKAGVEIRAVRGVGYALEERG